MKSSLEDVCWWYFFARGHCCSSLLTWQQMETLYSLDMWQMNPSGQPWSMPQEVSWLASIRGMPCGQNERNSQIIIVRAVRKQKKRRQWRWKKVQRICDGSACLWCCIMNNILQNDTHRGESEQMQCLIVLPSACTLFRRVIIPNEMESHLLQILNGMIESGHSPGQTCWQVLTLMKLFSFPPTPP